MARLLSRPFLLANGEGSLTPLVRLLIALGVGVGCAVAIALIVAIADLYLSGHGHPSITRELITYADGGVHLSAGDILMLLGALSAAGITWKKAK